MENGYIPAGSLKFNECIEMLDDLASKKALIYYDITCNSIETRYSVNKHKNLGHIILTKSQFVAYKKRDQKDLLIKIALENKLATKTRDGILIRPFIFKKHPTDTLENKQGQDESDHDEFQQEKNFCS
jgi:hypothetical protein